MQIARKSRLLFLPEKREKRLEEWALRAYTINRKQLLEGNNMDHFFNEEDLALLNEGLKEMQESEIKTEETDPEMDAAARRYKEIIKKHKGDQ